MPAYSGLLFVDDSGAVGKAGVSALGLGKRSRPSLREHFIVFLHLTFLLHDALLAIDAVIRSLARVFVTRQKLLEWETAAEAEASRRRKGAADLYLRWSPWLALALIVALWFVPTRGLAGGPADSRHVGLLAAVVLLARTAAGVGEGGLGPG